MSSDTTILMVPEGYPPLLSLSSIGILIYMDMLTITPEVTSKNQVLSAWEGGDIVSILVYDNTTHQALLSRWEEVESRIKEGMQCQMTVDRSDIAGLLCKYYKTDPEEEHWKALFTIFLCHQQARRPINIPLTYNEWSACRHHLKRWMEAVQKCLTYWNPYIPLLGTFGYTIPDL